QAAGRPLSDADVDRLYEQHLLQTELVQIEQTVLLRCLARHQVLGATDRRGEHPTERRVGGGDFLATLYRHLGVDADPATLRDPTGRPVPLLQQGGAPIRELTSPS